MLFITKWYHERCVFSDRALRGLDHTSPPKTKKAMWVAMSNWARVRHETGINPHLAKTLRSQGHDLNTMMWVHHAWGIDPSAAPSLFRDACVTHDRHITQWILKTFPDQLNAIKRYVSFTVCYRHSGDTPIDLAWLKDNTPVTDCEITRTCKPMFISACARGQLLEAQTYLALGKPTQKTARAALAGARQQQITAVIKWLCETFDLPT